MSRDTTPRPGLATLLTLRHARSEAAKSDLSAARAKRREREAALERSRDWLAATDLSEGDFAAAAARRAGLSAAVSSAMLAVTDAQATEAAAATRYQADRRSERVIEKLVERLAAAHAAARARVEQNAIDELALARYARAQRLGSSADRDALLTSVAR